MPALVLSAGEKLPLTTTWHLLLKSDDSADNHFRLFRVDWELSRLFFNTLLEHNLAQPDRVSGDFGLLRHEFLLFKLVLKSIKHFGV